jgi:hypothetical protein
MLGRQNGSDKTPLVTVYVAGNSARARTGVLDTVKGMNDLDTVVRPYNVLAILSVVLLLVCSPAALVCGALARHQLRTSGERGGGLALVGVIGGSIMVTLGVLVLLIA